MGAPALPAPADEYTRRVERARELMTQNGIDGLIVTDPVSYHYFTGHRAPAHTGRPSMFVLPQTGEPALVTMWVQQFFADLDGVAFPSWVQDRRFYTEVPFSTTQPADWGLRAILEDRGLTRATLAIELGENTKMAIPVADYLHLCEQLPHARFLDSGPVTWGCRLIKSAWEIAIIREACAAGGRAWQRCLQHLQAGGTAADIARTITVGYEQEGASMTFHGFARGATGPNRTFQAGDVLYLDGGCQYRGYYTDFTRRAVFGEPDARQKWEHDTALAVLHAMLAAAKPGVEVSRLVTIANQEITAAGLADRNYCDHLAKRLGHGIGLEQGEPPSLNAIDHTVLQEGMTVTIEPKFLSEDGLVNPDEQVLITAEGCEVLSTTPSSDLHVIR